MSSTVQTTEAELRFFGKVALVTGAGSGIGAAIARRLIADGAQVIVTDVSGKQDSLAAQLGERAIPRALNVADEHDVHALESWIRERFGRLDILMNNAGIGGHQALVHEYPLEAFDKVISINARGAFLMLQVGIRLMLDSGGAIVNTASIAGLRAIAPGCSAYIAAKGAIVAVTKAAAIEYAAKGIRINAVAPGMIQTAILDGLDDASLSAIRGSIPQGRVGHAEEVANVAVFLADDREASHVTGQIWAIDGGRTAGG